MKNEIVALHHKSKRHENILVVDWGATDVCNFGCSYCPDHTHAGKNGFVPYEDVIRFADKIVNHYTKKMGREVYFILTGGEVTRYKQFLPLVEELEKNGVGVGISSNGSQSIEFYERARETLKHISLSYHSEFTKLDHFIDVVNCVRETTYTHVNVMVNPDLFEQSINAAYEILDRTDEVSIDIQIVLKDFVEPYEYTDEQKKIILEVGQDINSKLKITTERVGYRGLMEWEYDDATRELIKPGDIMTSNMHNWKGWECGIGLEMLVIDVHGNIRRSWCGEGTLIGNVKDAEINFPDTAHTCSKEWCTGGISDIMITKKKTVETAVV